MAETLNYYPSRKEALDTMEDMATTEQAPALLTREDHRKVALAHLKGLVEFVPLYRGSKVPSSKFSNPAQRFQKPPRTVNVGAYPVGRTVILDIDTKSSLTVQEQLHELETLMTPRLRETFTVATPSGGCHLYLLWPEVSPLPNNGKLARLGLGITGDVRAAGINGQCVMAGSVVGGRVYEVAVNAPVLQLQEQDVARFIEAMRNPRLKRLEASRTKQQEAPAPQAQAAPTEGVRPPAKKPLDTSLKLVELGEAKPLEDYTMKFLRRALAKRQQDKFFVKRAVVYNFLSCCETPATIIGYWRALGIARDTYTNSKLTEYALRRDISRLTPNEHHSALCKSKKRRQEARKHSTPEEGVAASLKRLKKRKGFHQPRVLDMEAVHRCLTSGRQKPGKAYPLAWALVEDFLQPWNNLGIKRIVLNEAYLASFYGVTQEEVRQAKGLLLRRGVMKTVVKQAPGRSSVFAVEARFYLPLESHLLTTYLLEGETALYVLPRTSMVVTPTTGEVVDTLDALVGGWFEDLPPRQAEFTVMDHLFQEDEETAR